MENKLKSAFSAMGEWDKLGCPICHSPLHEAKECPQSKSGESKFHFSTRKELGVKDKALPFKFRIDINPKNDDEVEIARKRALLHHNSNQVYNLMGLAIKAQEAQRATLQYLIRLADELDIEGDDTLHKEREEIFPFIKILQQALSFLTKMRQTKIQQAVEMEEVLTTARNHARQTRIRLSKNSKTTKPDFWVIPYISEPSTNFVVEKNKSFVELFKESADAILEKEKHKKTTK